MIFTIVKTALLSTSYFENLYPFYISQLLLKCECAILIYVKIFKRIPLTSLRDVSVKGEKIMVKHVIIWQIKGECRADAEKIKAAAKENLEALNGQIPGMRELHININGLSTSNGDLMLDGSYDDFESLKGYSGHPKHVHVADTYIRPYMQVRMCFDYEVKE